MIASAVNAHLSEGDMVETWKVSPTVVLAILSSILNLALSIGLSIGISITWWLSAKRGATLAQLHYIWDRGASRTLWMAFTAGSASSKVALIALVVAAVKFANNPLLQQVVSTVSTNWVIDDTIKLDIAERIPDGLIGTVLDTSIFKIVGSREGLTISRDCFWNNTITTSTEPGYSCNGGTCTGRVRGAGIKYTCYSTTSTLDMSTTEHNGSPIFTIDTSPISSGTGSPSLNLKTLYSSAVNDSCIATLTIDTCRIDAAVVEYPVIIQNTTLLLDPTRLRDMPVITTYTTPGDSLTAPSRSGVGPLAGLGNFIDGYYGANLTVSIRDKSPRAVFEGDYRFVMANYFYHSEPTSYTNHTFENCVLKWSSPTNFILNMTHSFMFRAALHAGSSSLQTQNIPVRRSNPALVFKVDYPSLYVALALIAVALASLLILFRGWWELGREVTLSPLELAKAFQAPLLRADGNADVKEIIHCVGNTRVAYSPDRGMVGDETVPNAGVVGPQATPRDGCVQSGAAEQQEGDTSHESTPTAEASLGWTLRQNRSITY